MMTRLILIFVLLFGSLVANGQSQSTVSPPTISISPEKLILTIRAEGVGPFTYQWYRNNSKIVGQTSEVCTITTQGLYYVIVSNVGGSVTSGKVRLVDNSTDPVATITITRK